MPKFFVKEWDGDCVVITGSDVRHIRNVLRKQVGDSIEVCDVNSKENFSCEIIECNKNKIVGKPLLQTQEENNVTTSKTMLNGEEEPKITIFQGLPKADKMEWIIQKSVELGVFNIVPVQLARCVVKLDEPSKKKKQNRWQKIAEAASKQCGRNDIPEIIEVSTVNQIIHKISDYDAFWIAYEEEHENTLKNEIKLLQKEILEKKHIKNPSIGILIGPEGGLDPKEVTSLKETGATTISLGNRILRTETVSSVITSIIMYEFNN